MQTDRFSVIVLAGWALFIIACWVIPTVPFIRRLSVDKAQYLWISYLNIIKKPNPTLEETKKRNDLFSQLASAGYVIVSEGNYSVLVYPEYAR